MKKLFLSLLMAGLLGPFALPVRGSAYPMRPDPVQTPGDVCDTKDSDYSGRRYQAKIPYCRRNVSRELKVVIYEVYGIPEACRSSYTVDHLIPLSIGGSNSPKNLWPEHRELKQKRLHLEEEVFIALRDGLIDQETAIEQVLEEKTNPPYQAQSFTACP